MPEGEIGSSGGVPILVTPGWLKQRLEARPDPKTLLVVDTTWIPLKGEGRPFYLEKHIPGAVHFDINEGIEHTRLIPRNLQDATKFQEHVRKLGINKDTHIILYDRDDIPNNIYSVSAPKSWWIFKAYGHERVSMLDGGLLNWEKQGYGTTADLPEQLPVGDFVASRNEARIRTFDLMIDQMKTKDKQIIDTRMPDNFTGKLPEPNFVTEFTLKDHNLPALTTEEMKGGHMPGAKNVSCTDLLDLPSSCYKDKETLRKMINDAGADPTKPTIATCYIGHTACQMAMILEILGNTDVAVYYGSWTEWGQRAPQEYCVKEDTTTEKSKC